MLAESSRRRFLRETSGSRKCAARVVGDVDGSPARGTQDVHAAAISVIPLRRRYPRAFRAADRSIQRLPERRCLPIRRKETPRDCSGGRPGHTQRLRGRSVVAFIPLFMKSRKSRKSGSMNESLADDVEWDIAEGFPNGGVYRGIDTVVSDFFTFLADFDEFYAKGDEYFESGDHVIVLGRYFGVTK